MRLLVLSNPPFRFKASSKVWQVLAHHRRLCLRMHRQLDVQASVHFCQITQMTGPSAPQVAVGAKPCRPTNSRLHVLVAIVPILLAALGVQVYGHHRAYLPADSHPCNSILQIHSACMMDRQVDLLAPLCRGRARSVVKEQTRTKRADKPSSGTGDRRAVLVRCRTPMYLTIVLGVSLLREVSRPGNKHRREGPGQRAPQVKCQCQALDQDQAVVALAA